MMWLHRLQRRLWWRVLKASSRAGVLALLDERSHTWTIRGVKISDELIRGWAEGGWPIGAMTRLVKREDGMVTFERWDPVP